jgi:hypothetical protein
MKRWMRGKYMHRAKTSSIALAAVALLGAAWISGCSSKPNDSQLVTNIQSQMFADAQLKGASLQVASFGGQVTIKGIVPNDAARYEAYKIATQTSGVSKVVDQMVVENPGQDQSAQASAAPAPDTTAAPTPAPAPAPTPEKSVSRAKSHANRAHSNDRNQQYADNSSPAPPDTDQSPAAQMPSDSQQQPDAAPAPPPPAAMPPPPPPPPQPTQVEVAAGTTVSIRTIDSIDSSVNQAGEMFHASLDAPIVVGNDVVVPKGADVFVRLANASSAGKISGQSELRLELVKLEFQGQSYPLVSSTYSQQGASRTKDTAKKVGGGAVLGAIIGAVAGGGKGAAIGAAAGGGAGGVYQGATHGQQVKIPSETKLDFQLDQPVTVTVQPHQSS